MTSPFIQLHFLTSFSASLLNRDDVGFAKRLPFGGVPRLRVSSQCLKRHWRQHEGQHALSKIDLGAGPVGMSVRSRITFQKLIRDRLVSDGVNLDLATLVTDALISVVLGESAKAKQAKANDKEKIKEKTKGKKGKEAEIENSEPVEPAEPEPSSLSVCKTSQITVLGRPEVDFLYQEAKNLVAVVSELKGKETVADTAKKYFNLERRENLRGLKMGAGLDAALFGRMVTSDNLARTDAAIHVAHAFTVHEEQTESDFFSAIDDLQRENDDSSLGSGHIGNTELTSGIYYGYVAVDLPLLISNLTGVDRKDWQANRDPLASEVIRRLVHLVSMVSPGAKLGSTAPHAYAHFVMVEKTSEQPRTLGNAFLNPVKLLKNGGLLGRTNAQLGEYLTDLDKMYGQGSDRRFAGIGSANTDFMPALTSLQRMSLPDLATWAADMGE